MGLRVQLRSYPVRLVAFALGYAAFTIVLIIAFAILTGH